MKTVEFEHDGQVWHLILNGAALCEIYEKFPDAASLMDPIQGGSKAAFNATVWILTRMAAQGELYRRWQGYDNGPFPVEAKLRTTLSPVDVNRAKAAITEAIALGFGRSVPDGGKKKAVDLGLWELEQKKTVPAKMSGLRGFFRRLRSFLASLFGRE